MKTITDKVIEFIDAIDEASPLDIKIALSATRNMGKDLTVRPSRRLMYKAMAAFLVQVID